MGVRALDTGRAQDNPHAGLACPICGGRHFIASDAGRFAKGGLPPKCEACSGLERHRIVRAMFDCLPDGFLRGKSALQFSRDPGVPMERLGDIDVSIYGGDNSLDICRLDRPDDSYDWVIANHVVEHVGDDAAALREMLRVAKPTGFVQMTVPSPSSQLWTEDWGHADPAAYGHYRGYGSDLPFVLADALDGAHGLQAIGWDSVITSRWEPVYFFSPTREAITALGMALKAGGFPVLAASA